MNVEEYISSGILESYVIGQLTANEQAEVNKMITDHHEVHDEVVRIEESLEALAFATAMEPNVGVKSSILDQVDSQKQAPIHQLEQRILSPILKYAAAASIVVALGAVLMAYSYWNKWQQAEDRLASIVAQNQEFAENYTTVNQRLDDLRQSVSIMNSKDYERVVLNGTENTPNGHATVYWNESAQQVFLSIQNLKELSTDQQYQLWAIIDGKPVDAGVFDAKNNSYLVAMKDIGPGAAAFAVTIEPKGGSKNPSLETMQVVGNVTT